MGGSVNMEKICIKIVEERLDSKAVFFTSWRQTGQNTSRLIDLKQLFLFDCFEKMPRKLIKKFNLFQPASKIASLHNY